jgi:hypothetical protein
MGIRIEHIQSGWYQPDWMCPVEPALTRARIPDAKEPLAVPLHRESL